MYAKADDARTDGGNGGDDLAQLELVQNGSLAGSIKTHCKRERCGKDILYS